MNLAPVIERIGDMVPALAKIGGAAEFGRVITSLTQYPAAFVLPARESAAESPFMEQVTQQEISLEFDVVIAVRNLADNDGLAATQSLEPIRLAVRDALLGWQPDDDFDSISFVAGQLVQFEASYLFWTDTYRTGYILRSN